VAGALADRFVDRLVVQRSPIGDRAVISDGEFFARDLRRGGPRRGRRRRFTPHQDHQRDGDNQLHMLHGPTRSCYGCPSVTIS
jgi:hypothetical protein